MRLHNSEKGGGGDGYHWNMTPCDLGRGREKKLEICLEQLIEDLYDPGNH